MRGRIPEKFIDDLLARVDIVDVIQAYMPAQLGDAEIEAIIAKAIADSGATSAKDLGKVIGLVRPQVAGKADMGKVSETVKRKLAS